MYRIGQSTDIHQIVEGRALKLGGVSIDSPFGLLGHSDADVLLHAITEAIIGALGLGDMGKHFPDTDPEYKGADSSVLLRDTLEMMNNRSYEIVNIDSLVMLELPKLAPYIQTIRENIANLCQINIDQVNVKATRGEKLGFIGRGEGMQAQAVVLLKKRWE